MNCWIIPLLLLGWNQNGRCGNGNSECRPVEPPKPPCRPRERECDRDRECDCDCGRDRDDDRDGCPCNNNESRFEPRFDSRPFNNSGCGCDDR